jgi:NADH dehydrogenase
VIVGGGFGGLACVKGLAGARVDVLLVDRRNHYQFTPLLYQVATALLSPPDIARLSRSPWNFGGGGPGLIVTQ